MPTARTTEELMKHMKDGLGTLKTLRDEIRVEMHLAGLEAKQRWEMLERQLERAERGALRTATDEAKKALDETLTALQTFKNTLTMNRRPPA